jgi:hypothetical protein
MVTSWMGFPLSVLTTYFTLFLSIGLPEALRMVVRSYSAGVRVEVLGYLPEREASANAERYCIFVLGWIFVVFFEIL